MNTVWLVSSQADGVSSLKHQAEPAYIKVCLDDISIRADYFRPEVFVCVSACLRSQDAHGHPGPGEEKTSLWQQLEYQRGGS